jgi:hypothetical protein
MFNHVTAEDSPELFRSSLQIGWRVFTIHLESLGPASRQRFFGMIDSNGFDIRRCQKFKENTTATTDV